MRYIIYLSAAALLVFFDCTVAAPQKLSTINVESLKAATKNGKFCAYIKNAHFKEYLYTTTLALKNNNKRVRVFTWMNKADGSAADWKNTWGAKYDNQGLWTFEKKAECVDCYKIESVYHTEMRPQHLFSVANTDPEYRDMRPRRPVYAYRVDNEFPQEEGEDIWRIESNPSRPLNVRIQSKTIGKATGEYLYAVNDNEVFDSERRGVFTWSSQSDSEVFGEKGEWIIEQADCPGSSPSQTGVVAVKPRPVTPVQPPKPAGTGLPTMNTVDIVKAGANDNQVCVFLRNAYFNEYLYSSDFTLPADKTKSRVFTLINTLEGPPTVWKTSTGAKNTDQGLWVLEKVPEVCANCYKINSGYTQDVEQQYLFAVVSTDLTFKANRPNRPVYTYNDADVNFPKTFGNEVWKFIDVPNANGEKRLVIESNNNGIGEYFYAAGNGKTYDASRRNVFTWSSNDDSEAFSEQGEWLVEKTTCPAYFTAQSSTSKPAATTTIATTQKPASQGSKKSYTKAALAIAAQKGPVCVYLKNAHYKEYLYTTTLLLKDNNKRVRVFSWMKKADGAAADWKKTWGAKYDNQGLWMLEKQKECHDCYTIKSLYDKELRHQHLFSVSNTDVEYKSMRPRRPVYAYRVDNSFPKFEGEDVWKIDDVPAIDKDSHIRIMTKSVGTTGGEILYSVGDGETYDKDRRSVFTWASKEDSEAFSEQGEWIMETADCPSGAI